MRFKVVPPVPDSLAALATVREAVPVVPKPEDDCCARVVAAGVTGARDEASEWLTFARALGLVAESERGYRRADAFDPGDPADRAAVRDRFRERVYAVEDLLAVLATAEEPVDPATAFDRLRDRVPAWERQRHDDAGAVWRERVARLLGWAALFDLAERVHGGYGTDMSTDAE
jgi:hypothetical protein